MDGNDKECEDDLRRYICRRPCPTVVKVFDKTMLGSVVVSLSGVMLVMLFGIKFEQSKIEGLKQRLLFLDEEYKDYGSSSKGMVSSVPSEENH